MIDALQQAIELAITDGHLRREDFGAPASDDELATLEAGLGFVLPEDFRAFLSEIARRAPCPFPPPCGDSTTFELYLDQCGPYDVEDLLVDAVETERDRQRRPFPFTTRWWREVPADCFGAHYLTQAEENDFDRRITVDGLPAGASPFDGWLELWGTLQYCDSWYISYGLIVAGEARGQIWAHMRVAYPRDAMLMKPIAPSFTEWYRRWLNAVQRDSTSSWSTKSSTRRSPSG